ncbi:Na/Pi cotransporter family protein [Helicobacter sp. MIT 99-5507]|uniref:Na/Pi cotransporter family protein n=1 Tax=Helicobacter sp. MIT 99-5507 TaxID=152489 RepID=UPI000E1E4788|nr:Na/Pi symporter [Helicobacter sp. MIT 99-5507]RDU57316.1 hypothetical protein CQA42_05050 [Helicobacter sp. MIT 99-5507]
MNKILIPISVVVLCFIFYKFQSSIEIVSGVAIFLFGMFIMEDGFKMLSDGFLETMMKKVTSNTFNSILFGAISTTVMQSSTLISLFSISFVSAGIISLLQGIGIIFGSNLGNSTGAWIIASIGNKANISAFALPIIAFGVIFLFQKTKKIKGAGYVLAGIGFIFLGIAYIKLGFDAYSNTFDFSKYSVDGLKGMAIFTFIGLLATLIMQSTHASLVLIIAALSVNQITLDNAMALTIGAQLGSSITTGLGALNASIDGKRLAVAHILFNLTTALVAVFFSNQIIWLVEIIASLFGIVNLSFKLAIFHTLFNIIGIALMLPVLSKFVYYLTKFISKRTQDSINNPIYLDNSKINYANASIDAIKNETKHLYDNALSIIVHSIGFDRGQIRSFEPIEKLIQDKTMLKDDIDIDTLYEEKIKLLSNAIMEFTTKAKAYISDEKQIKEVFRLQIAAKNILEATKHMRLIQKNLQKYSLHPHQPLSNEYDNMRSMMAYLLRSIEELRIASFDDNSLALKKIVKFKKSFDYDDLDILNKIDLLISQKSISISQGTSMLNDLSFMRSIALKLVEAIGYLYDIEM